MTDAKPRHAAFRDTSDLAFAAYCHMNGLKIVKAIEWKKGYVTEYRFTFEDPPTGEEPDGRWNKLLFNMANSESRLFDGSVRTLKKLCKIDGGGKKTR